MRSLALIIGSFIVIVALPLVVIFTTQNQVTIPTRAQTKSASLSLVPKEGVVGNQGMTVGLALATKEVKIDGVDVVITFDASSLEIVGQKLNVGPLFEGKDDKVVVNQVTTNPKTNKGTVKFSAITLNPSARNGLLASFLIRPVVGTRSNGAKTPITIEFTPGSNSDSNVVEHGTATDVLERVENGTYTIL